MVDRTVVQSTYDDFLASEYAQASVNADMARALEIQEHEARLAIFPHSVVLQVAYPEMDYANRWCWKQFGPAYGECLQASSEYTACELREPHKHDGKWLTYWLAKTDYDFGFNEWCFAYSADRDRFLDFIPQISWGERFPK
jgi:hypothetical protein